MSKFLTPLQVMPASAEDGADWRLLAPLVYQSDVADKTFIVPIGFVTNFASVPRIPVVYELCGNTSTVAATLHDYLYSTHPVDREMADAVLREASAVTGVPAWRRWLMWAGVRLGGGSHWPTAATDNTPARDKAAHRPSDDQIFYAHT